jgi:hypothetical protein
MAITCAAQQAPTPARSPTATWVQIDDDLVGFMYCTDSGHARAFIDVEYAFGPEEVQLVGHEEMHKADATAMGCGPFRAWLAADSNAVFFEAKAYCLSVILSQLTPMQLTREQALETFSQRLAAPFYGFNLTPKQARTLIERYCPAG